MDKFLYHRVVKNMKGTTLYPLNRLKEMYPEVYAEHVKKYVGRKRLLKVQIPMLNCLWNDVIHLTAVAPHELKANLAQAGIELASVGWYKIPVSLIQGENSIAFLYRRDVDIIPNFKEYETFDPARMDIYRKVPKETIAYYKAKKAADERPLLFHLVPHVLYKGTIDTTNLEVVQS